LLRGSVRRIPNLRPTAAQPKGWETGELYRRHGIARACFYRWKNKDGGLELREAKRLRQLEEENRQLKHIVAEQAVDIRH
jgi:putative transposase